jgi:hypothetical protein
MWLDQKTNWDEPETLVPKNTKRWMKKDGREMLPDFYCCGS